MPTYTYECTECGDRFDIVQAFSEDALTTCERCAGRLRKRFNSVGIVFKGSGFYRTDSRESAKSSTNGSAKSDNGSGSGSAEKSSEKPTPSEKSGSGEKSAGSSTPSTTAAATT